MQNNLDYIRTVRRLGNFDGGDVTQVDLTGVLPRYIIIYTVNFYLHGKLLEVM
jgi:hypothetical protein